MASTPIRLRSAVLAPLGAVLSFAAQAQSVSSFTVVNADTDTDIATFQTQGSVSISSTPRINVRANTVDTARVMFSGTAGSRSESTAPFVPAPTRRSCRHCRPPAVSGFTIVNADTGADIATFTSAGTVSITNHPR